MRDPGRGRQSSPRERLGAAVETSVSAARGVSFAAEGRGCLVAWLRWEDGKEHGQTCGWSLPAYFACRDSD